MRHAIQNCVTEWSYHSGKAYSDPFTEVALDVLMTAPDGTQQRVPAFWAGGNAWRARYSSPQTGLHTFRTECSDADNPDLHGLEGQLEVAPYQGCNPLIQHGAPRVAASRRHLSHADGTPFFWLGDTWWMGLCNRLRWPDDFRLLLADRVAKGFNVVQIVAGLYPDMAFRDERGANEAGFPWEEDYACINPAYFDMADLRISALVDSGLLPCILGCWGYYILWTGIERMKQQWRYLIARYGAYPVAWCLAGEGAMPYYLSETKEVDRQDQKRQWTEMARYVRDTDPFGRLITIHPTSPDCSRNQVLDETVVDFDMLQTGHGDRDSIPATVRCVTESYAAAHVMPLLNSEVCYEGILEASREEIQRFMFWACILSGACGHTYGANGIWQLNQPGKPYGPSPHGHSWGDLPWTEAYQLPGSGQLGLARKLLDRYDWHEMEPHPEWVEPHWTEDDFRQPYAAGIPGRLRIIFMPRHTALTVRGLEPGVSYRAFYWNPSDATEVDAGTAGGNEAGEWAAPPASVMRDWVLVLERV